MGRLRHTHRGFKRGWGWAGCQPGAGARESGRGARRPDRAGERAAPQRRIQTPARCFTRLGLFARRAASSERRTSLGRLDVHCAFAPQTRLLPSRHGPRSLRGAPTRRRGQAASSRELRGRGEAEQCFCGHGPALPQPPRPVVPAAARPSPRARRPQARRPRVPQPRRPQPSRAPASSGARCALPPPPCACLCVS